MPSFDGTGPNGQGKLTGKGFGKCEGANGRGCGCRGGRGMGRRMGAGMRGGRSIELTAEEAEKVLEDRLETIRKSK